MNKEELIAFLKENMRVELDSYYQLYDDSPSLSVKIYIGDELICKDYAH